ncbi:hypothetical protein GCM10011385_40580 [Nitratireductor aestuarii]|uniref:Saccharopine dehydrogenase NADP binding domain-containing protein n=1 Tax=Nitratireductor aestuarii TaxID=1735103 RepID=A0A916S3Y0_9HYPH|nr:hypothetical protein [Nitratireductor aestuarii]GGA82241.1 hypothetical protein GCM10011385_40580 [Nitratireductor aestuarii]
MANEAPQSCDILVSGTGYYAEIMLADLATTARTPLNVVIAGRNQERLKWLVEACQARAATFGTSVSFSSAKLDSTSAASIADTLGAYNPRVVVQSASAQSPWKVDNNESDWARLVARAGFGLTIAFNSLLSFRTARAMKQLGLRGHFVNTCYPDGVNQVLTQAGLPLTTGVGNISIFSSVLGGRLPLEQRKDLRVIAHHRHIVEWRKPPAERAGAPVRAWVGEKELEDVNGMTSDIQLPYRDLNLISAAGSVPTLLALTGEGARRVHVPGPLGLTGGYPVIANENGVTLDLPAGMTKEEAVAFNAQFEEADGVFIHDGQVTYAERVRNLVKEYSPELAEGFKVTDVEEAAAALDDLRTRLSA